MIQVKPSSCEHTCGWFCLFSKRFLFYDSELLSSVTASCVLSNMHLKGTEKSTQLWSYHVYLTQLGMMCQGRNLYAFQNTAARLKI